MTLVFWPFQKTYISELEEARMELIKNNGRLKDEIEDLKKEKKNALSIIEVMELYLLLIPICM